MEITKEEFDLQFKKVLDTFLEGMAKQPEVDVRQFYSMTYFLENMSYFTPVIYGLLEDSKLKKIISSRWIIIRFIKEQCYPSINFRILLSFQHHPR